MLYFCWFWSRVIRLAVYTIRSRKKETRRADALTRQLEARFSGRFQPATSRKIAVSYGIYNPMICDSFARLDGRTTTAEEKRRYMLYFVCSSLFDDFTDYGLITPEELEEISFHRDRYLAESFDEKVFLYAHEELWKVVEQKDAYDRVTRELFEAQRQSRLQAGGRLADDALFNVTSAKGGNSVLLCRYYLQREASPREEACWYQIGVLIQLTNDLFDIHKDLKEGFSTPANRMRNAYEFERYFTGQIMEMKRRIAALPVSRRRRQDFSLSMAGIYAFGLIALRQLRRIQGTAEHLPDLSTLSRKDLVIDMEKPANLARWFRYSYRYAALG
jgi:hypothetical protein